MEFPYQIYCVIREGCHGMILTYTTTPLIDRNIFPHGISLRTSGEPLDPYSAFQTPNKKGEVYNTPPVNQNSVTVNNFYAL